MQDWVLSLVNPLVDSGVPIVHITHAVPTGEGHMLHLTFDNGDSGTIDIAQYVTFRGAVAPLQDLVFFQQVRVEDGTIRWPQEIDLDPVVIHALTMGLPIELAEPAPTDEEAPPESMHHASDAQQSMRKQLPRAYSR
jgi:hypothetical protein